MRADRVLTCWDYHHGQSTRILVAGLPSLRGSTIDEKQAWFEKEYRDVRTSLLLEPRGHANMLGAVVTDPVRDESLIGVLFTHPDGYFAMCGDSAFSLAAYLVDSGLVNSDAGETTVQVDTGAGPIDLKMSIKDGECESATIRNVASYALGECIVRIASSSVPANVAFGGLTYAMISAADLGLRTLDFRELSDNERKEVIARGSDAWTAARAIDVSQPALSKHTVDLVTLYEPLNGVQGVRVANFYGPGIMGRTPSGTGLSARMAWEHASGELQPTDEYVHESVLGLRFVGVIENETELPDAPRRRAITPAIHARSFLMGIQTIVIKRDDPFDAGFRI